MKRAFGASIIVAIIALVVFVVGVHVEPSPVSASPTSPLDPPYFGVPCPGEVWRFEDDDAGWGTYYEPEYLETEAEYFQYSCVVTSNTTLVIQETAGVLAVDTSECGTLHVEYLLTGREGLQVCTVPGSGTNKIHLGHVGDTYYTVDCVWRWALDCRLWTPFVCVDGP